VRHPRHRVGERNGNRRPTPAPHPEGTAVRPRPPGARRNRRPLFPAVRGGKRGGTNDVEATIAAMRSGCRRGSNLRRVSAARIRVVPLSFGNGVALPPAASISVLVAWRSRNAANPMSGTGTQQARTPRCGENRRGGAKPRGRNRMSWRCCHGPKARCPSSRTRVVTRGSVPGVDRRGRAGGGDPEGSSPRETGPCEVRGPRSRGARIAGGPVPRRARRTRSEGDGGGCWLGNAPACVGRNTLEPHRKRKTAGGERRRHPSRSRPMIGGETRTTSNANRT